MTRSVLFSAVAVASLAFLLAQRSGTTGARLATKPVPMLLLLAGLFLCGEPRDPVQRGLIAAGLVASLAGDVFLALPRDRFLAGLGSFLAAHLLYVGAFLRGIDAGSLRAALPWTAGYAAAAVALAAWLLPATGKLRGPVIGYAVAICAMCASAAARGIADGSWTAPVGATLFLASDSILAIDRFRRPFAAAKPLLYVLYAGGQACITASAWAPG